MAHNVRALAILRQYSTYLQTLTDCDIKEQLLIHPLTGASAYICLLLNTSKHKQHILLIHSSPLPHLHYFPHSSSTFWRQLLCLCCVQTGEKKKQPPVCFLWWLQLSSLFQTFKKVLWISSRSPASSRARPCTPLCSSPGLSVGVATHNQHEAVTSSFNREMVKNVELTNPPACTVKYMLLLNGYTLMLRWEHRPSVTYSRRAQNARIQYGVHTSLCIVSEQHAKHVLSEKKNIWVRDKRKWDCGRVAWGVRCEDAVQQEQEVRWLTFPWALHPGGWSEGNR